jgi:tight adherence protein B
MDHHELILLIALAAALATWGLAQIVISLLNRDHQKLQQRLGSGENPDLHDPLKRSITLQAHAAGIPPVLARFRFIRSLNQKLLYAWPETRLSRFLTIAFVAASLLFVTVSWAMDSLLFGLAGFAAGAFLPVVLLNARMARRQRALGGQLPEALDFLGRILRAGHSLSTALQMMGDELSDPIASEFRKCYDQVSLGHPVENAMRQMAARIDSSDFAFFVTAVLIQRQTGGDLAEVLSNISAMIRSRIRLQQHVQAITAEGRFTGYILVAFPAILFAITLALNPPYAGVLLRTGVGQMLLASAVFLQIVGLIAIRKIVNVKA